MMSSLALALAEDVSEEVEAVILDKMKTKMKMGCGMAVRIMRALEAHYGPEAKEIAHKGFSKGKSRPESEFGPPEKDLHDYIEGLEKACAGSHEWEKVCDEPNKVEYRFTRCMWAEVFRELDAADIGLWICEGDDRGVHNYNPRLRCRQTRTLMNGDPCCDHCFYVQEGEGMGEHTVPD